MRRVLIVEDEENIARLVMRALEHDGLQTKISSTALEAIQNAHSFHPELAILDVMLPDMDGFQLYDKLIKNHPDLAVLFLTARGKIEDRLRGFELGAEDYLVKPFSVEELLARVQVILRRKQPADMLILGELALDKGRHQAHYQGKGLTLTPTEFRLLWYLMENQNLVLTKNQIIHHVWDDDFLGDPKIVETYISYLRRKTDPALIETVRGRGYRFVK